MSAQSTAKSSGSRKSEHDVDHMEIDHSVVVQDTQQNIDNVMDRGNDDGDEDEKEGDIDSVARPFRTYVLDSYIKNNVYVGDSESVADYVKSKVTTGNKKHVEISYISCPGYPKLVLNKNTNLGDYKLFKKCSDKCCDKDSVKWSLIFSSVEKKFVALFADGRKHLDTGITDYDNLEASSVYQQSMEDIKEEFVQQISKVLDLIINRTTSIYDRSGLTDDGELYDYSLSVAQAIIPKSVDEIANIEKTGCNDGNNNETSKSYNTKMSRNEVDTKPGSYSHSTGCCNDENQVDRFVHKNYRGSSKYFDEPNSSSSGDKNEENKKDDEEAKSKVEDKSEDEWNIVNGQISEAVYTNLPYPKKKLFSPRVIPEDAKKYLAVICVKCNLRAHPFDTNCSNRHNFSQLFRICRYCEGPHYDGVISAKKTAITVKELLIQKLTVERKVREIGKLTYLNYCFMKHMGKHKEIVEYINENKTQYVELLMSKSNVFKSHRSEFYYDNFGTNESDQFGMLYIMIIT